MANYDLAYPGAAIDAILATAYDLQNAGYIFKGSATAYSGTPTQRTWLLAPAGFSGYGFSSAIPKGSIGICKWNGSAWSGDVINVVTIDNYPTHDSTNAVTSGGMWQALDDLADGILDTLQSFVIQDGTASANQGTQIKFDVKMTDGQQVQHLISSFGILAATTMKAGLMSAADKAKVDAFLDNLRSLSFTDTTPGADVGTKIVETLKMTVDGVQEAVTALTILAATTSKAGLMSATDKAYIDGLPTSLSTINTSISNLLAMLGYYECSTAAATAAKTVTATGYSLTNGGCIRIKMTYANTADNVTLNINSTGAKTLYYDGAQASATNTWEAGEVLEVYYDGTQYQCASGGGGSDITIPIDITAKATIKGYLNRTGAHVDYNGTYYHTDFIPVKTGTVLESTSGYGTAGARYAYYTSASESTFQSYDNNARSVSGIDGYVRAVIQENVGKLIIYNSIEETFDLVDKQMQDMGDSIEELRQTMSVRSDIPFIAGGYIDTSGHLVSHSGEYYTNYVKLLPGSTIYNTGRAAYSGIKIAIYSAQDESTFIEAAGDEYTASVACYARAHREGTEGVCYVETLISGEFSSFQQEVRENYLQYKSLVGKVYSFISEDEVAKNYMPNKYINQSANIANATGFVGVKMDISGMDGGTLYVRGACSSPAAWNGFVLQDDTVTGGFYGLAYGSSAEQAIVVPTNVKYVCLSFNPDGRNGDAANGYYAYIVSANKNDYVATHGYVDKGMAALEQRISEIDVTAGLLPSDTIWYVLGDSISHNGLYVQVGEHYYDRIVQKNNLAFNAALQALGASGYTWTYHGQGTYGCMYDEAVRIGSNATLITIFAGINDLNAGVELGQMEYDSNGVVVLQSDISSCNTFYRSVCFTLNYLLNHFTTAKVVIILPTRSTTAKNATTQKTLDDYWNALIECAEYYCVPVIPLGKEFLANPLVNSQGMFYDSVHLNASGQLRAAEIIEGYLKRILNVISV